MIDVHSHIMFGIDDGSKSIETSLEILQDAYNNGVTDIFLTPHYIEDSKYRCNNRDKEKILKKLKYELKKRKIKINLYIGNEIFINENIDEHIKNNEIAPLNNSKYLLIELPMGRMYNNTKTIFFELIRQGYTVILAHPERYRYMQDDDKMLEELLEMGVLLQGNYRSIFGYYGKDAKKAIKKFLKNKQISFLGSDIHKNDGYKLKKLEKKLLRLTKDKEYTESIISGNAKKILQI